MTQLHVHDSVLTVDTVWATGSGMILAGAGSVGWAVPHSGTMELALEADSLVELDSLAQELTGFHRDTVPGWHSLNGVLRLKAQLAGSLDSLQATGEGSLQGFRVQPLPGEHAHDVGDAGWAGRGRRSR